ncbi:hypothetical protein [Nonomuraea jabiensis]
MGLAGATDAPHLPADPLAAFPAHRSEIRIGYARVSTAARTSNANSTR